MPKMQDTLSPNAQEVPMWEITPREHAEDAATLGRFPADDGSAPQFRARHKQSAYAPLSFNRVLLFRKWGRLRKQRNLGLQLIFVLLECHPHQLPSGAHSGLLEKTLQNRLHITLGDL